MVTARPGGSSSSSSGDGGDHDCRFSKADVRSFRRRTNVEAWLAELRREAAAEDWLPAIPSVEVRKPGLTDSLLSAGVGTLDTCLFFFPLSGNRGCLRLKWFDL